MYDPSDLTENENFDPRDKKWKGVHLREFIYSRLPGVTIPTKLLVPALREWACRLQSSNRPSANPRQLSNRVQTSLHEDQSANQSSAHLEAPRKSCMKTGSRNNTHSATAPSSFNPVAGPASAKNTSKTRPTRSSDTPSPKRSLTPQPSQASKRVRNESTTTTVEQPPHSKLKSSTKLSKSTSQTETQSTSQIQTVQQPLPSKPNSTKLSKSKSQTPTAEKRPPSLPNLTNTNNSKRPTHTVEKPPPSLPNLKSTSNSKHPTQPLTCKRALSVHFLDSDDSDDCHHKHIKKAPENPMSSSKLYVKAPLASKTHPNKSKTLQKPGNTRQIQTQFHQPLSQTQTNPPPSLALSFSGRPSHGLQSSQSSSIKKRSRHIVVDSSDEDKSSSQYSDQVRSSSQSGDQVALSEKESLSETHIKSLCESPAESLSQTQTESLSQTQTESLSETQTESSSQSDQLDGSDDSDGSDLDLGGKSVTQVSRVKGLIATGEPVQSNPQPKPNSPLVLPDARSSSDHPNPSNSKPSRVAQPPGSPQPPQSSQPPRPSQPPQPPRPPRQVQLVIPGYGTFIGTFVQPSETVAEPSKTIVNPSQTVCRSESVILPSKNLVKACDTPVNSQPTQATSCLNVPVKPTNHLNPHITPKAPSDPDKYISKDETLSKAKYPPQKWVPIPLNEVQKPKPQRQWVPLLEPTPPSLTVKSTPLTSNFPPLTVKTPALTVKTPALTVKTPPFPTQTSLPVKTPALPVKEQEGKNMLLLPVAESTAVTSGPTATNPASQTYSIGSPNTTGSHTTIDQSCQNIASVPESISQSGAVLSRLGNLEQLIYHIANDNTGSARGLAQQLSQLMNKLAD
ncbi:hypothetical protein PSHT_06508 [Puccinia striiformis]|uniref:Uncharacterized protein n=1 Tax=Puccinia striiformis TaxID=27350 RepID=A0A2S4W5Y9_9BASI|nr:hypothetical protein PSHT_06508 [Puccinia striiformis]